MPITPFHFGPGAALHAISPRHVSFLAFCAANVLTDLESLYFLLLALRRGFRRKFGPQDGVLDAKAPRN